MSRIGSKPVSLPKEVSVQLSGEGCLLIVKGDSSLTYQLPKDIEVELLDSALFLSMVENTDSSALLGLHRSEINNTIIGITEGFQVDLEINGVGYKAALDRKYITLWLGFSHCIKYRIPDYVSFKVPKPTQISIFGTNKCHVNMIASDFCNLKKYNPYKKKGIYRKGQYLFTKEITKK